MRHSGEIVNQALRLVTVGVAAIGLAKSVSASETAPMTVVECINNREVVSTGHVGLYMPVNRESPSTPLLPSAYASAHRGSLEFLTDSVTWENGKDCGVILAVAPIARVCLRYRYHAE